MFALRALRAYPAAGYVLCMPTMIARAVHDRSRKLVKRGIRRLTTAHSTTPDPDSTIQPQNGYTTVGDLSISFGKYLVEKNGQPLDLTSKEFEILALLAANPGKVFTRQQIYEHIWGEGAVVDTNSITVFIRRIREKIEDNASRSTSSPSGASATSSRSRRRARRTL